MRSKVGVALLTLLAITSLVVASCAGAPTEVPATEGPSVEEPADEVDELPAAPPFDSACMPEDEGAVEPVDQMPSEPLRIAVLGLENNPFWIPVKEGTMEAAETLRPYNTTVEWIVPGDQHTAEVFGRAIESAVAQEYDAIATVAGDAGVAPYINRAVEAGIPVATFNSETEQENLRLFFVGADLYNQGLEAGRAMAEAIGGEGKVAIITGFFAVEAHELRRMGFVDYLEENHPGVEIVSEVENEDKADIAYNQAQDFMSAHPDLAGIYVTAGGPFGAAGAVEAAGKAGEVQIISFDFVEETMEYVQKGVIYGTIGQNPFAQGHDPAIRLYNYLVGGQAPECGRLITRADLVTQDNIDEYWSPSQ